MALLYPRKHSGTSFLRILLTTSLPASKNSRAERLRDAQEFSGSFVSAASFMQTVNWEKNIWRMSILSIYKPSSLPMWHLPTATMTWATRCKSFPTVESAKQLQSFQRLRRRSHQHLHVTAEVLRGWTQGAPVVGNRLQDEAAPAEWGARWGQRSQMVQLSCQNFTEV